MLPSPYNTVVGVSLLALCLAGCQNNGTQQPDETTPPDPLVVPQSPERAQPLHLSEEEDYEEYEEPRDDDQILEPESQIQAPDEEYDPIPPEGEVITPPGEEPGGQPGDAQTAEDPD